MGAPRFSVEDFGGCDNSIASQYMSAISTYCPRCHRSLEIPVEFDNVICPGCATGYWIRRHGDLINLSEIWPDTTDSRRGENAAAVIESRLLEIDELMEAAELEIESLRSREQSVPLQKGCAFFGLFMMVIVVIALFMLVGKSHVGSWVFYVFVATAVLLSLARIRRKFVTSDQLEELRQDRMRIEDSHAELRVERDRIQDLKARLER
jgi:hypothetical protein